MKRSFSKWGLVGGILVYACAPLWADPSPPRQPSPVNMRVSREVEGAIRAPLQIPPMRKGPFFSLSANLQYTPRSDMDETGRVEIDRQGFSAGILFPGRKGRMVGAAFDQEFSQYDFSRVSDEYLHNLFKEISISRMTLTWRDVLNEQWSFFAAADVSCSVEPGADWEKGLTGGGIISFRRQWTTNFAFSLGLFGRQRIEENPLIMLIPSIDWQITRRLGMRTAQGVTLDYRLDERKRWMLDLSAKYEGREFRLDRKGPVEGGVAADRRVPVLLGLRYSPNPGMSFYLYGGVVAWQEFKIMEADGEGLSVVKTDPAAVMGASASLRF